MVERKINFEQGGVYLAKLDPAKHAEIGKIRPVAILTNEMILQVEPQLVFICPLSTTSYPEFHDLHVTIAPRDSLLKTSFALVDHCKSISIQRITSTKLAQLDRGELSVILSHLQRMVGL